MQIKHYYHEYAQHPAVLPWLRRLAVVTPALFVLAFIMLIRFYFGRYGVHMPPQITFASLIPVAFVLWLKIWDEGKPPRAIPSVTIGLIAFPVFMIAGIATAYPLWTHYRAFTTFAAIMMAIILYTGVKRPLQAVRAEPVAAILSILLGAILYIHGFLHETFWSVLCEATANVIAALTKLAGFPIGIKPTDENVIYLSTDTYSLMLAPPCSGMDGMAIFFGLLTVVFLMDWRMFKGFPFARLYVAGFFLMFLINALRILVLFSIGAMGAHPNAPEWMKPFKDAMFAMFHDHVGWTVYVLTFAIFVTPLYRMAWERQQENDIPA
jgi:exosortase/archaeosortase family protein